MKMKKILLLVLISVFLTGCATPKGVTKKDQRNYVLKMQVETLAELYKTKPETRDMIR